MLTPLERALYLRCVITTIMLDKCNADGCWPLQPFAAATNIANGIRMLAKVTIDDEDIKSVAEEAKALL